MKKVREQLLLRGDIVLTTSEAWESGQIRSFTKSDISHAMVCVASSSVMDSTTEGVHARNIAKMFYPDDCAIHVLRFHPAIAPAAMAEAIDFVRGRTAAAYDIREAIRSVVAPFGSGNDRQFCSRLVARAYASAGVELVKNPNYCTPADILRSPLLVELEDVTEWISEEDAAEVERTDATVGMRKVTMKFIDAVRQIAPDVRELNDAIPTCIARPEHDEPISQALRRSGYLDHWKVERDIFPWRYASDAMVQFANSGVPTAVLRSYCESTLASDEAGEFDHWRACAQSLSVAVKDHPRLTIYLLQELYGRLNVQHDKRIAVAQDWLAQQGAANSNGG